MQEIKDLLKEQIKQTKLQNKLIAGGFLLLGKYLGPMHRTAILQELAEGNVPAEFAEPDKLSETYHGPAWQKYTRELTSLLTLDDIATANAEKRTYADLDEFDKMSDEERAKIWELHDRMEENGFDLVEFMNFRKML